MAEVFKQLQSLDYFRHFINHKIRPDGRALLKFRQISLNVGSIQTANGSAIVRFGKTAIVCGIKAELGNPKVDEPSSGFIVPNLMLPPLCSSTFKPGPPSELAQVMSQRILDVIHKSNFISLDSLCIVKGKLSWCLYVDIVCMNFEGNVFDAAILALLAAASCTMVPVVSINEETGAIEISKEKKLLQINSKPVSTSFCFFEDNIIADPTYQEEKDAQGTMTVVMTENGICCTDKNGEVSISDESIQKCLEYSKKHTEKIQILIKQALTNVSTEMDTS